MALWAELCEPGSTVPCHPVCGVSTPDDLMQMVLVTKQGRANKTTLKDVNSKWSTISFSVEGPMPTSVPA